MSDIYEEFKGWAEASDIHVNLQIDNPEIGMWIDPEHFGKILSNILSNSIRYSHAGSEINIQVTGMLFTCIILHLMKTFENGRQYGFLHANPCIAQTVEHGQRTA